MPNVDISASAEARVDRRDEAVARASVLSHELAEYVDGIEEALDQSRKELDHAREAIATAERLANDSGSYYGFIHDADELATAAFDYGGAEAALEDDEREYRRFLEDTFGAVNGAVYKLYWTLGKAEHFGGTAHTYCLNAMDDNA